MTLTATGYGFISFEETRDMPAMVDFLDSVPSYWMRGLRGWVSRAKLDFVPGADLPLELAS